MSRLGPEDWQRVNEIFHQALDRSPDSREAFVRQACAARPELAGEVTSLLAAHERAGSFIEPGGAVVEARSDPGPSLVGQTLGQYRIDGVLGEGGMGVVYLAQDVRLGRSVALKAVAPQFTGDPARRDRLMREARAAAALTHPGIATVYALEDLDGQIFIVGEYVPGETLRDELGRSPLPPARALEPAAGLARALAAAHDRGVVHRDLKPENVIRTPAGEVKILDFGLARMRDVPAALARLTDDGTLLGTPAYMSPEQIRGEPVDGRSDLFSLGVMLFELLSGVHPFAGRDPASTIARILEADPPRLSQTVAAGGAGAPMLAAIEGVLIACLRKTPSARYASAHELAAAIERVQRGSAPDLPAPPAGAEAGRRAAAVWWWQFHQGAVSAAYPLLVVSLWLARGDPATRTGRLLFLTGLMSAIAAVALRLHLWFTLHHHRDDWPRQQQDTARWIRLADAAFVAALLVAGVLVVDGAGPLGALLVGAAAAVLVSSLVIEPAAARRAREG